MKTSLAILLAIFALSGASDILETVKPCRLSDPEYQKCLDETITSFVTSLGKGNDVLNVTSIEPLDISKIKSGQTDGPVSLKQEYRNIKFYGLTKGLRVTKSSVDLDTLVFTAQFWNPRLYFVADYEAQGQILLLPVVGKGKSNVTMIENVSEHTVQLEKFVRDGETYLRAVKYNLKFNPKKVLLQFDHILDDNKALAAAVQSVLKENGDYIFQELKAPYDEAFSVVFKNIFNRVMVHYPMKYIFPK